MSEAPDKGLLPKWPAGYQSKKSIRGRNYGSDPSLGRPAYCGHRASIRAAGRRRETVPPEQKDRALPKRQRLTRIPQLHRSPAPARGNPGGVKTPRGAITKAYSYHPSHATGVALISRCTTARHPLRGSRHCLHDGRVAPRLPKPFLNCGIRVESKISRNLLRAPN